MAPRMPPGAGYPVLDSVEDHEVVPQSGDGVPRARMYDPLANMMERPPMRQDLPIPMRGGIPMPVHDVCVYEDNGQKFMIKDGCIYKQTWTTIENGGECRMFDVRKGKKASPKGIVIQKYDWVPLSVANMLEPKVARRRSVSRIPQMSVPVELGEDDRMPPVPVPPTPPVAPEDPPSENLPSETTGGNDAPEKTVPPDEATKPVEVKEPTPLPVVKPIAKPVSKHPPKRVAHLNAGTLSKKS